MSGNPDESALGPPREVARILHEWFYSHVLSQVAFRRRGSERLLRGDTSSNSTSFEEGSPHGVNLGYLSE